VRRLLSLVAFLLLSASLIGGCQTYGGAHPDQIVEFAIPVEIWPGFSLESWRQPRAGLSNHTGERITRLVVKRLENSRPIARSAMVPHELIAQMIIHDYEPYGTMMGMDPVFGDRIRIAATLEIVEPNSGTILNSQRIVRTLPLNRFHNHRHDLGRRHSPLHEWSYRQRGLSRASSQMRMLERVFASAVANQILITVPELATALSFPMPNQ